MALRLRSLLALGALSLIAAGHAPARRPVSVTYETVAKRADVVLQELSQRSGVPIESTEDAKLHYLVVSVKDADFDALLERIAKVMSSQVLDKDGKKVVQPDARARILEKQALDNGRIERFKKAQDWIRTELNKKPEPPNEGDEENYDLPMFTGPEEKALAQMVLLINPREAANLGAEGRLVFSNVPNKMQKPLSGAVFSALLATLAADHNKQVDEMEKQRQAMKEQVTDPEQLAYMAMFGDYKLRRFETPPAKAVLVLEFEGAEYGLESEDPAVKLKVYDQKGEAIVVSQLSLNPEMYQMMREYSGTGDEEQVDQKAQQKPITEADRTPVKLSENSKVMSTLAFGEDLSFNFPDAVRALLRDPVTNDPLSFQASDNLTSIAQTKKLNVVANLVEGNIGTAFEGYEKEGTSVGQVYNALAESEEYSIEEKDGWYVLMPANPISARTNRQDRYVLRSFIQRVESEGRTSLDALATFAMNSPSPVQNGASSLYMLAFAPTCLQGIFGDTMDWNMLRLYGNLLPTQKTTLMQGGRVPFSQLAVQAQNVLRKMAFGSTAHIQNAEQMKSARSGAGFMDLMMRGINQDQTDYTEEPTEAMPNGLPGDGFVTLEGLNEPIISPSAGGSFLFFGFGTMGAEEMAMYEFFTEVGGPFASEASAPKLDKVRMGSRERLNFSFWLTPAAGIRKSLLDDTVSKDAPEVPISQIPTDFRATINKRKQEFKDSPFGKMMAGFGGGGL